ncbi:MAG: QueT transporter family protein [Oscillospiraceae bacterium]
MKKFTVQHLATAAVVGVAYAVLSIFGSVFGVTFGPVQCRFAEALCVLPFFFPETAGGLFVGCPHHQPSQSLRPAGHCHRLPDHTFGGGFNSPV